MEFKKFTAGSQAYGQDQSLEDSPVEYAENVTNVNFYDPNFDSEWADPSSSNY